MAADELGVACTYCGALAGWICRSRSGRRGDFHSARKRDWKRVGPQMAASAWNRAHKPGTPVRLDLGPIGQGRTRRTVDTVTVGEAWVRFESPVVRVEFENRLIALKFITAL